ncbi:unnamed protein product [Linum trigynum]|uniref:Uncharacterized protein n=1 Tax=Linum trigynum TaxID=586398 RepID=A0AAV2FFQ2_9ROSI
MATRPLLPGPRRRRRRPGAPALRGCSVFPRTSSRRGWRFEVDANGGAEGWGRRRGRRVEMQRYGATQRLPRWEACGGRGARTATRRQRRGGRGQWCGSGEVDSGAAAARWTKGCEFCF